MSTDISAFRHITRDSGYVRTSGKDKTAVTHFQIGLFGKIRNWLRGPDAAANKAIRTNFFNALRREYGVSFLESKEISALLGGEQGFKTSATPLPARLVRHIISKGDNLVQAQSGHPNQIEAKLRLHQTNYNVSLSYESPKSMYDAAARFHQHAGFDAGGSALIRDIAAYLNNPSDEKLTALAKVPHAARFAEIFEMGNDTSAFNIGTQAFKNHCLAIGLNPNDITTPAMSKPQIPLRLNMLFQTLVDCAHKKPAQFEAAVGELLAYVPRQVDMLKNGIQALSNPDIIFKGMPKQDIQTLTSLRADLGVQLNEVLDSRGLCQHLLAFATVLAMDPEEGQAKMQALITNQP